MSEVFVVSPVPAEPSVAQLLVLVAERDRLILAQSQALAALSVEVQPSSFTQPRPAVPPADAAGRAGSLSSFLCVTVLDGLG